MSEFFFHRGLILTIYPSDRQKHIIRQNGSSARFVYNRLVAVNEELYHLRKAGTYLKPVQDRIDYLKEAYSSAKNIANAIPFLTQKDIDSDMIANTMKNYMNAWKKYREEPNTGIPTYHKKDGTYSYQTSNHYKPSKKPNSRGLYDGTIRFLDKNHINLPILGRVRFKCSKKEIETLFNFPDEVRIGNCRISIDNIGRCYVSLSLASDTPFYEPFSETHTACGIDLNLSNFLYCSDGTQIDNPKFNRSLQEKISREQRKLSLKRVRAEKEGRNFYDSKNYQEQKKKVASLQAKAARRRSNFHWNTANEIVKSHDYIFAENLKVKNLLKNHKLAYAISDVSWSEFLRKLSWSAGKRGKTFLKVNPKNTTQTCSECGHICSGEEHIKLGVEDWICPVCGAHHIRDYNASKNILALGLNILKEVGITPAL